MSGITIYEFDVLVASVLGKRDDVKAPFVPEPVFSWLQSQIRQTAEAGEPAWLRLTQWRGQLAIQVTSFVGVIQAPDGFQIEVLPKIGKSSDDKNEARKNEARERLIDMLCCLGGFRHIVTDRAKLAAKRMPLLEVFICEFLLAVEHVVKRGIRGDYASRRDNMFTLRGKLQMAAHLRQNLCRRDRFFTEFEEFSTDRPENRLLHTALRRVLTWTVANANQQLARELCFVFADVPLSSHTSLDFQKVQLDRGMTHYADALAWARLILEEESPLTGSGGHLAPSLLFPMEAVFEAFVAKNIARQLASGYALKTQARNFSLVRHQEQDWFRLKPDLLVLSSGTNCLVMDTKWKLIDGQKSNGTDKYGLSQADFYQLYAYGQRYLNGEGDMVLIYPGTDEFKKALPVFEFPKPGNLRLWVLPFCLLERTLVLPFCGKLDALFDPNAAFSKLDTPVAVDR